MAPTRTTRNTFLLCAIFFLATTAAATNKKCYTASQKCCFQMKPCGYGKKEVFATRPCPHNKCYNKCNTTCHNIKSYIFKKVCKTVNVPFKKCKLVKVYYDLHPVVHTFGHRGRGRRSYGYRRSRKSFGRRRSRGFSRRGSFSRKFRVRKSHRIRSHRVYAPRAHRTRKFRVHRVRRVRKYHAPRVHVHRKVHIPHVPVQPIRKFTYKKVCSTHYTTRTSCHHVQVPVYRKVCKKNCYKKCKIVPARCNICKIFKFKKFCPKLACQAKRFERRACAPCNRGPGSPPCPNGANGGGNGCPPGTFGITAVTGTAPSANLFGIPPMTSGPLVLQNIIRKPGIQVLGPPAPPAPAPPAPPAPPARAPPAPPAVPAPAPPAPAPPAPAPPAPAPPTSGPTPSGGGGSSGGCEGDDDCEDD